MNLRWTDGFRAGLLLGLLLGGNPLCAQDPGEGGAPSPEAEIVKSIRVVESDGRIVPPKPGGLAVKLGEPLDRAAVAASIRTLYQTGDYADVRATTTPEAGGVRLDFVVRDNLFINQILVEGLKPPPTESSAAAAMQLTLGQTYRAGDVEEALARLSEALRTEGLYRAKVHSEPRANPLTHQLDLLVRVDPGARVRLSRIEVINSTHDPNEVLLRLLKIKPGSPLTSARQQAGTERIRKYFEKSGYLSARVSLRRGEYDERENTVPLILDVAEGPRVRVTVEGAKFSESELRRMIPIYQEGSVDADLLAEGQRNLRERMEREGYFDAQVNYRVVSKPVREPRSDLTGSLETIEYTVNRGARHKLVRIEFVGNHYFSTGLLRSRLSIQPSSLFERARFSRRLLDADVLSMKNLYAANGFLSAVIEGQIEDASDRKEGDLVVRFLIDEGKQTLVAHLELEGMKAISEEELRSVVGSLPGQPYSEIGIASDRDNILALYFNQGFPDATFSWSAEPDTSRAVASEQALVRAPPMKLVYQIHEGPQVIVRSVLLAGYHQTRPHVIQREVKLKPGEPLREGDVVESQQHLYNLGVFNRVTIETQNASGTDPDKVVVVLVEEAKRYTIAYGGGFEVQRLASTTNPTGGEIKASPRGIFEISKQNVTGRADTLTLKIRASTIQGRALLGYSAPNTFNRTNLSIQATTYVEKTQDISTFTETRYEGNLQLTDRLSARSSLIARYAFRKVTLSNLNIPPEEVPLYNQPTRVSEFSGTWFRDTRDNPADANKGSFNTASVGIAGTAIGSSASFVRIFLQNSTYSPISRNWSFARSIRIGILEPYASTVSLTFPAQTTSPPPQVIPLPERLYAGGDASLRGFALNQAGPRDSLSGFPVGGQALLLLNQELRFPLRLPWVGRNLGGALFYDGGNSYTRLGEVTLRWSPPEPVFKPAYPDQPPSRFNPTQCLYNCTNALNYFSNTVGFGLRYATPIGPIRVDLGYLLNRAEFVIPCANSAVLCQQGTHLPKLQVFFNLGSSF